MIYYYTFYFTSSWHIITKCCNNFTISIYSLIGKDNTVTPKSDGVFPSYSRPKILVEPTIVIAFKIPSLSLLVSSSNNADAKAHDVIVLVHIYIVFSYLLVQVFENLSILKVNVQQDIKNNSSF